MCSCEQGTCPGNCSCGCNHTPPTLSLIDKAMEGFDYEAANAAWQAEGLRRAERIGPMTNVDWDIHKVYFEFKPTKDAIEVIIFLKDETGKRRRLDYEVGANRAMNYENLEGYVACVIDLEAEEVAKHGWPDDQFLRPPPQA